MLSIEYKATGEIIPYINNSRTHSEQQIQQVAASIKEFGFTNPILIDQDGGIIAGHGRLLAAQLLQMDDVPTITLEGLSETDKKAYVIADNQLALNAGWDIDLLKLEIDNLSELDFDISLLGFDDDFLSSLVDDVEGKTDEDAVPEAPEIPVTVEGDVWILGNHRLMCGDSTSIDAVDRLMDGQKADMVFTDPPYNVDFSGSMGDTTKNGKKVSMKDGYIPANSVHEDIKNDKKSADDFGVFISDVLSSIKQYCAGGWYICFASSTLNQLLTPLIENEMKWKSIIIWNKNQSPMGGGHFRKKYEPIVYGYFNNAFYGKEYSEDDVWDVSRTLKNDLHPTMKPVELVERAIGFSSIAGGVVLDIFGGSGSTLIACEKTNRHSRLMELDPKYCDVIIKRWQEFTGQEALMETTGKSYSELANEER